MDRPFKIRVETEVDDKGAKAAAENLEKAAAAGGKAAAAVGDLDRNLEALKATSEGLGINAGLATAVNPTRPKSAAQPREVAQDLEPTSLAELELLRGAEKSLQNRLLIMRAIGAEESKELEMAAKLESIQAALNTAGAKRLAADQAAGLAQAEAEAGKALGTTRQLRAVLRLLPADLGPLGMIAAESFSPWILAVGGAVAAYELLKKTQQETFEQNEEQVRRSTEEHENWGGVVRKIQEDQLNRGNDLTIRNQHLADSFDPLAEAKKRDLEITKQLAEVETQRADAVERLTRAAMQANGASPVQMEDEQTAFRRQKQRLAHEAKAREIAIQRDAAGKEQAEADRLGQSATGVSHVIDLLARETEAAKGRLTSNEETYKKAKKDSEIAEEQYQETPISGLSQVQVDAAVEAAKHGMNLSQFRAGIESFGGTVPLEQENLFQNAAADVAAKKSQADAWAAIQGAKDQIDDLGRKMKYFQEELHADQSRQKAAQDKAREGFIAADTAEGLDKSQAQGEAGANAIDDEATRINRLAQVRQQANAGDPHAQMELAAATSFGGDFSKLFQGVTGQPFRGGDQFATVLRQAFQQHQDGLLDSLADLIKGTLLNGLQHSQEQIEQLKRELANINSRARYNRGVY